MKKWITSSLIVSLLAFTGCSTAPSKQAEQGAKPVDAAMPKEITVAGSLGLIETAIRDVVAPKFEKETGIKIKFLAGTSIETLSKVEIQAKDPKIDLLLLTPVESAVAEKKNLHQKINENAIPNLSKLDDRFVTIKEVAVPIFGYVLAPAYNTKIFEDNKIPPILSWNDLIRAEYKGNTAFSDVTADMGFSTLYNFALANGGSLENIDPGIEKGKELARSSDTFYKASPQIMAAMQQGAAVTVLPSYSVAPLAEKGIPLKIAIPKEGAPMQSVNAVMVKNAPNQAAAEKLISFMISEDVQKGLQDMAFYSVLNGKVIPKYEESIGLKETDKVYKPDVRKLAEMRDAALDRWKKEVNPELGKSVKK